MTGSDAFVGLAVASAVLARPLLGAWERRLGRVPSLATRLRYLLLAGALVLVAAGLAGVSPADVGIAQPYGWRVWMVTALGTALLIGTDTLGSVMLLRRPKLMRARTAALEAWIGQTPGGPWLLPLYLGVAAAYEELVFRGLGLHLTEVVGLPVWAGVAILAGLFGLQHTASGKLGMAYATGFALVFSALYLGAGSLLAPIVAHAVGNMYTLQWTYPRLKRRLARLSEPAYLH